MIDFNKLAHDIYEGEATNPKARIAPKDPHLSTYQTIPRLEQAFNIDKNDPDFVETKWDPWWDHWRDTRAAFIERFGQTQPDIEILILERTLREYFER